MQTIFLFSDDKSNRVASVWNSVPELVYECFHLAVCVVVFLFISYSSHVFPSSFFLLSFFVTGLAKSFSSDILHA